MNQKDTPVFVLRRGQKQANLDILNYVAQHQPCGFLKLFGQFGQSSDKGFKTRLSYLVLSDQLQADKAGSCSMESWTFALGEMAGKRGRELSAQAQAPEQEARFATPGKPSKREKPPVYVGVRTPTRKPDPMHSDMYQPKPWHVPRPGAQDFKAAPSVGTLC